ncbi:MAG TPA: IS4 family transposase [Gemmataceae bacterium]|nr:IS4 family transposase [Gemmataceae bacterium]
MSALQREIVRLALQPSAERIQALQRIIPRAAVQAALRASGQHDRRCPRLPKWFMVWFVIALALFCTDRYAQVYKWLQRWRRRGTPGRSTLCEARQRLGVSPLRLLADRVVQLQATPEMAGAFYHGLRLMALDSFVVDVADSAANDRVFGRPGSHRSRAAFPQVRVLALCEVGTHILWKDRSKPQRRSEVVMATSLLRFLEPDMLLLWDRSFLSYAHVQQVRARRAHLLARLKKNLIFTPLRRLHDGSFLAKLYPSAAHRQRDQAGLVVRILEYTFDDPGRPGSGQKHRLLTTLLDAHRHPAKQLITLYHQRWEEELTIDEFKTHLRQRPVLRSETPAGVVQEIYGLLLGHYVVRKLMCEAATTTGLAPRRLSFTGTLKILRCRLPEVPKHGRGLGRWFADLIAEIAEEVLEPRRDRVNPRVIKRKMSNGKKKRPEHRAYPQPTKTFRESLVIQC